MEASQVFLIGEHDQLISCTGGRHIDELSVILQPFVGAGLGLRGNCRGKQYHVLFVALKSVNGSAYHVLKSFLLQRLLDQLFLIDKGSDHSDGLVSV